MNEKSLQPIARSGGALNPIDPLARWNSLPQVNLTQNPFYLQSKLIPSFPFPLEKMP
jgi:hypothetical protein